MAGIVATDALRGNGPHTQRAGNQVPGDHPYLRRQLIAYLGNKRRLLPFFRDVFFELMDDTSAARSSSTRSAQSAPRFVDAFAGSGAVSRLAKLMGFQVAANDWEPYARILNAAFIGLDAATLPRLFRDAGGVESVRSELNALGACSEPPTEPYVSRHFAPSSTESADYRRERLFYTAENARFLDHVRQEIERRYPEPLPTGRTPGEALPALWSLEQQEKVLLLALLLVEASVHANTSGVFKAYHKGFGGHGGDALQRILGRMELEYPELIDPGVPAGALAELAGEDAAEFLRARSGDIIYLDPPYNSHQYGSNYFMLNTIAAWDRPPVPDERDSDGSLRSKAGIREDWRNTRSAFCYEDEAVTAFRELLGAADGRHLVVSYNTEGVVALEVLLDILEERGRVRLYGQDYVTYRGGRQSLHRRTANTEFLLAVRPRERPGRADRVEVDRFLRRRKLEQVLAGVHHPGRIATHFQRRDSEVEPNTLTLIDPDAPDDGVRLELVDGHRLRLQPGTIDRLSDAAARRLEKQLQDTVCRTRREEAEVVAGVLEAYHLSDRRRRRLVAAVLKAVRKFAHRKYAVEFQETVEELRRIADANPDRTPGLRDGLDELLQLFERRTGSA